MRKFALCLLTLFLLPAFAMAATPPHDAATQSLLNKAFAALGGRATLEGVKTLHIQGIAQRHMLEQSTRPEGPWIPDYAQIDERRDFATGVRRVKEAHRGLVYGDWHLNSDGWTNSEFIADDRTVVQVRNGKTGPGRASRLAATDEALTFDPIRLMFAAAAASDLHREADRRIHEVEHHVLAWHWRGRPVHVYINADSGLPDVVEWTRAYPYSLFLNAWGDVHNRLNFDLWTREAGGLRYPRLWALERNGQPARLFSITRLDINPADSTIPAIDAATRKAFADRKHTVDALPLGRPDQPPVAAAKGVLVVPGYWNIAFVEQADGIVVLEAPISSSYSAKVLDAAKLRFPGKPVKAVITTSDAWPHIAGLREYVARGIPVYALDRNRPILQRLLAASHREIPDTLARHPRKPVWHWVAQATTLGSGPNRMRLIPAHTQTGERQMFIDFPAHKLLYTSDLMQPYPGEKAWFTPEFVAEAAAVAKRESLDVKRSFGMHYTPTDWAGILDWLRTAAAR